MKKLLILIMSFGMFGCDDSRFCYYDSGHLKSTTNGFDKMGNTLDLGEYRDVLQAKEVADKLNCPWKN